MLDLTEVWALVENIFKTLFDAIKKALTGNDTATVTWVNPEAEA